MDKNFDLVFLTIGGNDAYFGSIAKNCFVIPSLTCNKWLKKAEEYVANDLVDDLVSQSMTTWLVECGRAQK